MMIVTGMALHIVELAGLITIYLMIICKDD